MLPDIHLDQMSFREMVDRAKNRIVSFYPEWTDFNYHDPGMTLIELFAWLKEIQQYELDHIGEGHKKKYLQLLGTGIRHKDAAECFVTADVSSPCLIQKGCRLEAEGVVFETGERQMLPGSSISCCFGWQNEMVSFLDGDRLNLGQPFLFYPFGNKAGKGTCLYIVLTDPLPIGETMALTIHVNKQNGWDRNPASADMLPLAKLEFSFWNGKDYELVELVRDETFGFLFDGQILFRINGRMQAQEAEGKRGYFLRVLLSESQYDTVPAISFLNLNTIRVQQKETVAKWLPIANPPDNGILWSDHRLCKRGEVRVFVRCQNLYKELLVETKEWDSDTGRMRIRLQHCEDVCQDADAFYVLAYQKEEWYERHAVLGTGHGFPNESFELDESLTSVRDLEILVEEADEPGTYQKWEKREDFASSGPSDQHYCVDSMTGRVIFGNGIHGMAPEGKVLLISYARILGLGGNIKAERIQNFTDQELLDIKVTNLWDACGGVDEETVEEAFMRVRRELLDPENLVTAQDYERMVKSTPGLLVESCKAFFGSNEEVSIVVKPNSLDPHPRLSDAFVKNILRHLSKKRLLGVRIKVLPPTYIRIAVLIEAVVLPQYQEAEKMIKQEAEKYLSGFLEQFGGTVSYSSLYGQIDRLRCVAKISSLMLETKGNGVRRNPNGDLIFPENGIVQEIDIDCSCLMQG
ncbi:MAG: baseplate J/gp47 family protein [Lachnospiraceae bacterium]|nr:baseplate J/gp47 family protein [Lachnospiraceae bacterium]